MVATPVSGQHRATAITNVNIVPMDRETVLENMTIVVRNGVIESLLPADNAQIPANATVIDGDGKYLIPGLTDMYVHVRTADALKLYIARGFTTVHMIGFTGDPLGWRAAIQRGDLVGPRLTTSPGTTFLSAKRHTPRAAAEEGEKHVDLSTGTHAHGPHQIAGLSTFDKMERVVEAGLRPYDALRALTITPAKALGNLALAGTIAVGKNADFMLVDGNPLENLDVLRKPSGVMAQGRWLDRDELRYILAEAIESVTWCRARCG